MDSLNHPEHKSVSHAVDCYIGKQIRLLRKQRRITQQQLGDATGLSFQQIQKYENGQNRITTGKLYDIAKALSVKPAYFFEKYDELGGLRVRAAALGVADEQIDVLYEYFLNIATEEQRNRGIEILKAYADGVLS